MDRGKDSTTWLARNSPIGINFFPRYCFFRYEPSLIPLSRDYQYFVSTFLIKYDVRQIGNSHLCLNCWSFLNNDQVLNVLFSVIRHLRECSSYHGHSGLLQYLSNVGMGTSLSWFVFFFFSFSKKWRWDEKLGHPLHLSSRHLRILTSQILRNSEYIENP